MRILNNSKFVVSFLLGLILLFSILLAENLNRKSEESENPPIGVLTFKTKTVLRKYDDQVVWDNIESSTQVRNRDTIRTEDLSDAVLTLNDGTKINISENSMILLDISDKNININFAYGSFEADRENSGGGASKINIKAGDKTIEMEKGDIKLDKTKTELNVKVGQGEAKINSNGVQETIQKDQVANVSESGLKILKPKFSLILPEDKKNFFAEGENEVVSFSIGGISNETIRETTPVIEIGTSPDFSRIIEREKLKSGNFSKSLGSGAYYWRVNYVDPETKSRSFTEIKRFRVLKDPPLRLFLPKDGEVYSYLQGLPIVKIAWNELELYSNYTAQIATDPSFTKIIETKQTQNQSLAFDSIGDGNYYVRVIAKSFNSEIKDRISEIRNFSIQKRLNLEPPVLLEPNKGKSFVEEQKKNGIFFTWRENKDYDSYIFELSSDASFSRLVKRESLSGNYTKEGKDLAKGTYYWRVRGISSGKEDKVSNTFDFQILSKEDLSLLSPINGIEIEWEEGNSQSLRWKKLSQKADYKIEIFRNNSDEPFLSEEPNQPNYFDFRFKEPGKYIWRVVAQTSFGERIVSPNGVFYLVRNIEPPVLVSPTKNETIDISNRNIITFSWKPVEGAEGYNFKIIDISTLREKNVLSERLKDNRFSISDFKKLNDGRFRWEVSALYKKGTVEKETPAAKSEFTIFLPALNLPKIFTPGKIYVE